MAYIQERQTEDGKIHYRVQIRLKGFPTETATFDRKTRYCQKLCPEVLSPSSKCAFKLPVLSLPHL